MAAKVPKAISSILCSSSWTWNPHEECTVKFDEDGTGELVCTVEFTLLIASQFEWEIRSTAKDIAKAPPVELELDMTLKKRDIKGWPGPVGWTPLSDAAFKKKTYQLRLEQGSFRVEGRTTFGVNPTYRYRLTWDQSPYPPLEEWKDKLPAAAGEYWKRKDFYKCRMEDVK